MQVPSTASHVEVVSGLAPSVHAFVVWNAQQLQAVHPFVPTVHAAKDSKRRNKKNRSFSLELLIISFSV